MTLTRTHGYVLIATILVVVGVTVAVPLLQIQTNTEPTLAEYNTTTLVPNRTVEQGAVPAPSSNASREAGVVLVDTQHSNRFDPGEIHPLVNAIDRAGYRVEYTTSAKPLRPELATADAYVVIDPGITFTPDEVTAVQSFTRDGGRLLLVGEPDQSEVGPLGLLFPRQAYLTNLGNAYGFSFASSYVYNMHSNDGNYQNVFGRGTGQAALGQGVDRVVTFTATTVTAEHGRPIVVTEPTTRDSATGKAARYPLAVVDGNVLAIGDKNWMFQSTVSLADNEVLLGNVVTFLMSGHRSRQIADYPTFLASNPTVTITSPKLLDAAQTVSRSLRGPRGSPSITVAQRAPSPNTTDVLITAFDDLAVRGIANTGINADGGRVTVGAWASGTDGVAVIHREPQGYSLVIAADSPAQAERAASVLSAGAMGEFAISRQTAVLRNETTS